MPNYNYRSGDCTRRTQYVRPVPVTHVRTENCTDTFHKMPVAMAYVPWQDWRDIYPARKSLCQGTIFEELDKPFLGKGGCCK